MEPVLSEILYFAQNDKRKLGVRMTESEGLAITDRMGFLPLNEHGHNYVDIVVHADGADDARTRWGGDF